MNDKPQGLKKEGIFMNVIRGNPDNKQVCSTKSSVCVAVVLVTWLDSRRRKDRFGVQGFGLS